MIGQLTTYGVGLPLYTREAECKVDPQIFVELEAAAAAIGGGYATAIFLGEGVEASATCEVVDMSVLPG